MSLPLYATVSDLLSFAPDFGLAEWGYLSTGTANGTNEPSRILKRVVALATADVERALGIPRRGPTSLPGAGNPYLRQAALYQAVAIIPTLDMEELRAKVATLTDDTYSDGIVSIGRAAAHRELAPVAAAMVRQYQSSTPEAAGNPLEFCRG